MSQQYFYPPSGGASSNASVGTNGIAIPGSSTLVAGKDPGALLKPLSVDVNGVLNIAAASLPLPAGAATEATLAAMSLKLPATLGAHLIAASMAVNIASDQVVPISASALPLPSGASTSALQTSGNASLSSIDGKLPVALGQQLMAASLAVVLASDQNTLPVSVASLPLPSGAATSALQTSGNSSLSAIDVSTAAIAVSTASTDAKTPALVSGRVPVDGSGVTQPISASSLPLPSGASTSAKQPALGTAGTASADVITVQGVSGMTPVKSDQVGRSAVTFVRNDYSSVNVTTAAYVQLIASTSAAISEIEIFDSSGQTLKIAFGAAASEVDQILVYPGGNGRVPLAIPASTRVSIKAVSATASVGELDLNCYA